MQKDIDRHFKLYKPAGYLSQFISHEAGAHKKKYLGGLYHFPENTMAVGRLDENSEGLLLLTTNGKVSHAITGRGYEKEYFAQVDGIITEDAIEQLRQGVVISISGKPYTTMTCVANSIPIPRLPKAQHRIRDDRHGPTSWVAITVTEGKFRQIRKMTAAVGFATLRLVRVRIGDIFLDSMQPGDCEALYGLEKYITP